MYQPKPDVSVLPNLLGATLENHRPVNCSLASSPLQTPQDHCQKKIRPPNLHQFDPDQLELLFPLNHVFQQIKRALAPFN